jgi:cytochrome c553
MTKGVSYLLCFVITVGFGSIAYGQGDATAGKQKAALCAGCHAEDGNSTTPIFPRLAGQHEKYLIRQLADFKSGKRADPTMQAMAAGLSEEDMKDLGAFYQNQSPKYVKNDEEQYLDEDEDVPVTKKLIAEGKALFIAGNELTTVAACNACHGSRGSGNGPAGFPSVKGQYLPYLIKSLNDFRDGLRENDDAAMMRTIAGRMSRAEIDAVSAFLSNLH